MKINCLIVILFVGISFFEIKAKSVQESHFQGPSIKSQVAKILLSSLGGAVLGISTLSFYDRPQDHLANVAIGGTIGAMVGSIYVTKESLEYDSIADLRSGGNFQIFFIPKQNLSQIKWGFEF